MSEGSCLGEFFRCSPEKLREKQNSRFRSIHLSLEFSGFRLAPATPACPNDDRLWVVQSQKSGLTREVACVFIKIPDGSKQPRNYDNVGTIAARGGAAHETARCRGRSGEGGCANYLG